MGGYSEFGGCVTFVLLSFSTTVIRSTAVRSRVLCSASVPVQTDKEQAPNARLHQAMLGAMLGKLEPKAALGLR